MTIFNAQGGDLAVSVGGVNYYTDPGSMETFDRQRSKVEQATASRNNAVDWMDGDSTVKCNVKKFLCDTDGAALFPILGLGATIGLPTLTTIIYRDPNRTSTCANQMCNDVTISGERGKPWELDANFLGTSAPALTAGYQSSRPSFGSVGNYLYWRDLLSFFSAATTSTNCQKWSIKVNHNLDPFPGVRADGYTIPTVYTPTEVEVTASFTMQMLGSADYALYLAACDTPADIGITAVPFCAVGGLTLTCTLKLGIYDSVKPTRALRKASLEDFTAVSKAIGGANQGVITLA